MLRQRLLQLLLWGGAEAADAVVGATAAAVTEGGIVGAEADAETEVAGVMAAAEVEGAVEGTVAEAGAAKAVAAAEGCAIGLMMLTEPGGLLSLSPGGQY